MKDLKTYFINPFTDERHSLNRKKKFGEDHIKRITVQNTGGELTEMLNSTIAVQTNFFGAITSVSVNASIREARTEAVDQVIEAFKTRNTRLNNYLLANGTDKQAIYQEFFPQGITAFTREVNKGNVAQLMDQLVKAITRNPAIAGGTTVLSEYTNFLNNYNTARGEQLTKMGEVSGTRGSRNSVEDDWDDQMFNNLLTLANLHRQHPETLGWFMNQTILHAPQHHSGDGKGQLTGIITIAGAPAANIKVHIEGGNIPDTVTDDTGGYATHELPIGTYQVVFSREDLRTRTDSVTIIDDGDTLWDVAL